MNDLFETVGNISKPMTDFYNLIDKVNEFDLLKNAEQLEATDNLQHGSEVVEPDYVDNQILKPKKYYRLHIGNSRYYYDNPNDIKLRASVTTVLHSQMPTSSFLLDWLFQFDNREAYSKFMQEKADYGTIMHVLFTQYLLNKEINVLELATRTKEIIGTNIELDLNTLKKDVICFMVWVADYKVKPIAVELPVMNSKFAGTIDLLCELEINGNKHICLVDYKSGKKGFYDSHRVQLNAYKELIKECYDINVDYVFNFAPSDFTKDLSKHTIKAPIYKFENQSNDQYMQMWELYSQLYLLTNNKQEVKKTEIADILNYDNLQNLITINTFKVGA